MGYAEHGAADYDALTAQGCLAAGEPTFLLRAQDITAPGIVRDWADEQEDEKMRHQGYRKAALMEQWQREHVCKYAD